MLIKNDILASIVVFFVALPLCLGISLACGMPVHTGLIAGIIGGIIVGLFSGSPLQVSGPAAGMVVLVIDTVSKHGAIGLFLCTFLAGIMQVVAGKCRLAQYFKSIPIPVVNGMMSGIGLLIFSSQFHVMLDESAKGSGPKNLLAMGVSIVDAFSFANNNHLAAAISFITIGSIILWENFRPQRLKDIPAAIIAISIASLIIFLTKWNIHTVTINTSLLDSIKINHGEWLAFLRNPQIYFSAFMIFAVSSAETIVSMNAVDALQKQYVSNFDKELMAQGLGNALAGLAGALPITGVIVRSKANISSEAKTRLSTILHGFLLLIFVVFFSKIFESHSKLGTCCCIGYYRFKINQCKIYFVVGKK